MSRYCYILWAVCNPMLVAKVIYSKIPISIQKPAPYGHLTLIWFGGICTELPQSYSQSHNEVSNVDSGLAGSMLWLLVCVNSPSL